MPGQGHKNLPMHHVTSFHATDPVLESPVKLDTGDVTGVATTTLKKNKKTSDILRDAGSGFNVSVTPETFFKIEYDLKAAKL